MVGKRTLRMSVCALFAGVLTAIPVALAFSTGADAMHTAGSLSNGAGCNAVGCHPFNAGPGSVELIGAPRRYRAGAPYDFAVRVSDATKVGAGFEISVEKPGSSVGTLVLLDAVNTRFTDGDARFVTHTGAGVADSIANWAANGNSFDYPVGWDAPSSDIGPVHFLVSGVATNDGAAFVGENYYWTFGQAQFARPGDADGDTDLDLSDFAVFQMCFGGGRPVAPFGGGWPYGPVECAFLDMETDDTVTTTDVDLWVNAMGGPTATDSAGFVLACAVRGGRLYDKWWTEANVSEPTGDHPLYPAVGIKSGSTTYRCKECHGWDYKGVDGVYGGGSHFTGIRGVFGSTLTSGEMFSLLKADPSNVPNGHDMDSFGLSDQDLWDLVRFVKEGTVDTDDFIDVNNSFPGDSSIGFFGYSLTCVNCHGSDGREINFGTPASPEYVGTIAVNNPWEFLHKLRFGHPHSAMPAMDLVGWTDAQMIDVAAYAATLPVN